MFTKTRHGNRVLIREYHLCLICFKWFCVNDHPHIRVEAHGTNNYAHKACMPTKINPIFLGYKK